MLVTLVLERRKGRDGRGPQEVILAGQAISRLSEKPCLKGKKILVEKKDTRPDIDL